LRNEKEKRVTELEEGMWRRTEKQGGQSEQNEGHKEEKQARERGR
jgi:hypothetical protein